MDVKSATAATAYIEALNRASGLGAGPPPQSGQPGSSFAEVLSRVAEDAVAAVDKGEKASLKSLSGEADLVAIVTAVSNAEITLQTVVALKDKVVQAYQEIIRMSG
ncbi:MAG: flagellar hook-basal body complex protein FliE [Alphaproteobacteria bacterium]|nr:flagellar hook-basal body complex protein FliE [Alphaproteobacteria bacterium]